ncbi:type IV pilin [Halorubrum sp. SD626R]|nr:type IV pilin [Halorubrum sp. SD626R]
MSPVIGVILMVAITVILAAVIGTFVLGLGDQLGDTAPQASFEVDSVTANGSTGVDVDITKTGGQGINPNDLVVIVDGTRTATVADNSTVTDPWQTGVTASVVDVGSNDYSSADEVEISLVHDPSGNVIFETTTTLS